jgi:hypothetical protein
MSDGIYMLAWVLAIGGLGFGLGYFVRLAKESKQ